MRSVPSHYAHEMRPDPPPPQRLRESADSATIDVGAPVAIRQGMSPGRPLRILVVDDDINACSALGALLRDEEREVVLAHDGIDALVKLASFPADVIVTDVKMPRMDGLALFDAVRSLPMVTPRFVFMSASVAPELDGGVRYVTKPIAIERLCSLIEEAARPQ